MAVSHRDPDPGASAYQRLGRPTVWGGRLKGRGDAAAHGLGPQQPALKAPGGGKHRQSAPSRCSLNRLSSKCMRQLPKPPFLLGAGLAYVVAAVLLTPWISEQIYSRFALTLEAAVVIVAIPLVLVPVCVFVAWTAILYRRGHL